MVSIRRILISGLACIALFFLLRFLGLRPAILLAMFAALVVGICRPVKHERSGSHLPQVLRVCVFVVALLSLAAPWGRHENGDPMAGLVALMILIFFTAGLGAVPVLALFLPWVLVLVNPAARLSLWTFRVVVVVLVVSMSLLEWNTTKWDLEATWGLRVFELAGVAAVLLEAHLLTVELRRQRLTRKEELAVGNSHPATGQRH